MPGGTDTNSLLNSSERCCLSRQRHIQTSVFIKKLGAKTFLCTFTKTHTHVRVHAYTHTPACCSSCLQAPDTCLHCQEESCYSDEARSDQWAAVRTAGEGGGNSPPLSLFAMLLYTDLPGNFCTGPGRGQQPACLMNTKQNLSLTGELQKSSVFIYSFFSFRFFFLFLSCLLPPYFFSLHGIQLYISPSWHHSEKKEWDERNKTEPKCGNFSSLKH